MEIMVKSTQIKMGHKRSAYEKREEPRHRRVEQPDGSTPIVKVHVFRWRAPTSAKPLKAYAREQGVYKSKGRWMREV